MSLTDERLDPTINPAIAVQPGSLIRALNALKTPESIDLGLGEPTLSPKLAHFEAATRWVGVHGCRYSTNVGDAELRAAIAAYYAFPALPHAGNVCVTTGSAEAVFVALKTLLDPAHDEILLVEPAFPIYAKIAQLEGVALRRVALSADEDFAFDPERIVAALTPATRMIVLCSPCNPSGRVISRAAVDAVATALERRPGPRVVVLHDEIYRELQFTDDVGSFGDRYAQTVAINSLSKSNALTGLRIGWLMAPLPMMPHLVKMHGWATSCANTFSQRVALEVFAAGELASQRPWYAAQRAAAVAAAAAAGLRFVAPEGAFYLFVETGATDGPAFSRALLAAEDVVAIPGSTFGPASAGWLRTTFVAPLDRLAEGYARIARFVARGRSA